MVYQQFAIEFEQAFVFSLHASGTAPSQNVAPNTALRGWGKCHAGITLPTKLKDANLLGSDARRIHILNRIKPGSFCKFKHLADHRNSCQGTFLIDIAGEFFCGRAGDAYGTIEVTTDFNRHTTTNE